MKKLTNVSPFLLLLAPVFFVMIFAFTLNPTVTSEKEIVDKSNNSPATTVVKAASIILN